MPASSSALSLRISNADRQLIDRAAKVAGKTRTQFMLDSARAAATDTILDQRLFILEPDEFKAFEEALAKAPHISETIEMLKKRPLPWKR
jgi:uncharacterized protein (DUF1778 family)